MDNAEVPIPTQEEASTEKDPPAQEKAIKAVNDGLSIYEADIPEASQTPSQKAEINEVKRKLEDLANGGDGTETVELKDESGKVIKTQKEGIPVYELVEHLNEKYKSLPKTSPQAKELRDIIRTLTQRKVTRDYLDLPYRWIPRYYQARVREEISRIKADGRTTGDDVKDEQLAKEAIARRREFFVPPPETTTPPPTTPPPTTPPPQEDPRFTISFVDTSDDAKKIARESSGEFVREQLHVKNRWSPREWMRAIKFRLGEDYHKITNAQKVQEEQVRRGQYFCEQDSVTGAVREVNNGRELSKKQMQSTAERFSLAGEGKAQFYSQEKHEKLADTEISSQINNLITRYARGELSNEQFETERQGVVELLKNNPDVAPYIKESNFIASDILEVAQKVKLSHERGQIALENLDRMLNIQIGRAVMASTTEADYTRLEKTMNWLQGGKFRGLAANPLFIGVAFGVAGAGAKGILGMGARAATGFPIVGGGIATAFAGLRRWTDLKRDFELNERDDSYSRKANPDKAPRRAKLAEFRYNIAEGGGRVTAQGLLDRLTSLSNTENPTDTQIEEILTSVAEIDARINYGIENKIDLMAYANRYGTESEKLKLVLQKDVALEKIKAIRKAQGRNDDEIKSEIDTQINTKTGEFWSKFSETKDKQNARFNRYRFGESLKAAGIAAVTATIGGLATQEILAIGGRALGIGVAPTIVERALGINPDTGSRFGGLNLTDVANKAGSYNFDNPAGQKMELVAQAFTDPSDVDRKIDFVTPDKKVVPGPAMWVTPDKGNFVMAGGKDYLPPEVKDMFGNYEFKVTSEHNLREYMKNLVNGDIGKTPDEVLSYGNFLLNTHDIKQSNFINPEGLPYDEWAAKVSRINPTTGLVEEGKMSITHPTSGVQLHGFLRGDGSFDVNKDFYVDDQFPGNKNITPDQFNNVVSNLKTEGWGVEDTASGYHITPPEAFELTAHLEEAPIIPIPFAPRHPLEPLTLPPVDRYPYYNFGYELFRRRDGTPATLSDIIRFRSPELSRDSRVARLFPPRTPTGTSSETAMPEPEASEEGERALALIHETFVNSPHIYLSLSGAIGDVVIDTAYLEGVRQYAEKLGQQKKITLITPANVVPLLEPMAQKYGYEIVTQDRYRGVEKATELINQSGEENALVFEFEHHTGRPVVDLLPNGGLVVNDLFASSVGLYDNGRSGDQKFTDFFSDLLTIPQDQRFTIRPRIELPANSDQIFDSLKSKYNIDTNKQQVSVILEASHQMKRYSLQNWQSVLQRISQDRPNSEINIIFNPAGGTYTQQQLQSIFGTIPGVKFFNGNMVETEVFIAHQNLVLSNDTGFAHVAAVVEGGPQVISLHVPVFPPDTWVTDQRRHLGLLPRQELLNYEFNSDEPNEARKWINQISPDEIAQRAIEVLQSRTPAFTPPAPRQPRPAPTPSPRPPTAPASTLAETLASEVTISGAEAAAYSEASPDHRNRNEDAILSNPERGFIGVFDGVGGEPAGDVASRIVRDNIGRSLQNLPDNPTTQQVYDAMTTGYQEAIQALRDHERDNPDHQGMCTTGTIVQLYVEDGVRKGVFMHAGDSRAYAVKRDGTIQQLTEDDSSLTDAVKSGKITPERAKEIANLIDGVNDYGELPDYAKPYWETRNEVYNIFYANQATPPKIQTGIIGPETLFIITTSDGVHDNLKASEIAAICKGKTDPEEISKALVSAARDVFLNRSNRRAKPDDVSAAVIKVPEPPPATVVPTETVESTTTARPAIRVERPEPVTPQDLQETKSWANVTQIGHSRLETARRRGTEEDELRDITARVRLEQRIINERYQTPPPLSDPGQRGVDWELQSNPGILTCQFASAGNILRALNVYDPNKHSERDFIDILGGQTYAEGHRGGASQSDMKWALENSVPEVESRYSNSVNEILQAVENGAGVIVPLGPGHVGAIMPGNRVTKDAAGNLQVQVLDPLSGPNQGPRLIPIDDLIKSDISVPVYPGGSPAIIIERKPDEDLGARIRLSEPETPPAAPAEEVTEELPVVAPVPPAEAAPEPPALPPEELDRRRQALDAYIERYMQDNPGLSPEEARRQVIERLNQGRGQNG